MDELYSRMLRQSGWQLGPIRQTLLVIAARGPAAEQISLAASAIGFEHQLVLAQDVAAGLELADATMRHNPQAYVDVELGSLHRGMVEMPTIFLMDLGDPATRDISIRARHCIIGFAEKADRIDFGTDLMNVVSGCAGRPLQACAELAVLVGELLSGICSVLNAYSAGENEPGFAPPPRCARVPLAPPPGPDADLKSRRIYVGGFGGAIAHQILNAMAIDPVLQAILSHPDSLIVGADDDVVEESNRSRQLGYLPDDVGRPKAEATRDWLARGPLARTRVVHLNEPIALRHAAEYGPFDVVLSSVDSWDARRTLVELARQSKVPAFLSSGSSFFGGFERIVTRESACMSLHGVEQLAHRPRGTRRSCADAPEPSSVIPQAIVGGLAAAQLRDAWLGRPVDPRGAEVHLLHTSSEPGFAGLRHSPGRLVNATCPCVAICEGNAA
jgi:molybdopterin/thiamine biosynthesis adenylyltransferase